MSGADDPTAGEAWDDLLTDATAMGEEYREHDWDVTVLSPLAVSPAHREGHAGFDVRVPDETYETLESLLEDDGMSVDGAEVFSRIEDGAVYALAVELDDTEGRAVVVPVAYHPEESSAVLERALEEDELSLYVRPAAIDRWVTFFHDDPGPFLVTEDDAVGGDDETAGEETADEE
ncbi:DUF7529 family protein [Natronobiforma cellulositropha]|uniref:DUF7529 family protein n=1 Tax=Natronobiforma cellulositropha TaxID=1679076 RepID=UPI0021D56FF9|nr:hypothetical protein [Natronobiforma cellulositropha]